eukprot:SAG31_NODE_3283_length_4466_cov_1.746279_6_plen_104_part_00
MCLNAYIVKCKNMLEVLLSIRHATAIAPHPNHPLSAHLHKQLDNQLPHHWLHSMRCRIIVCWRSPFKSAMFMTPASAIACVIWRISSRLQWTVYNHQCLPETH